MSSETAAESPSRTDVTPETRGSQVPATPLALPVGEQRRTDAQPVVVRGVRSRELAGTVPLRYAPRIPIVTNGNTTTSDQ